MYRQIKTSKRAQLLFSSSSPHSPFFHTTTHLSRCQYVDVPGNLGFLFRPNQAFSTYGNRWQRRSESGNPNNRRPPQLSSGMDQAPPFRCCVVQRKDHSGYRWRTSRDAPRNLGDAFVTYTHPHPAGFFWVTAQSQSLKVQSQKPSRSGRRGGGEWLAADPLVS